MRKIELVVSRETGEVLGELAGAYELSGESYYEFYDEETGLLFAEYASEVTVETGTRRAKGCRAVLDAKRELLAVGVGDFDSEEGLIR
jgi:hypothetical protein